MALGVSLERAVAVPAPAPAPVAAAQDYEFDLESFVVLVACGGGDEDDAGGPGGVGGVVALALALAEYVILEDVAVKAVREVTDSVGLVDNDGFLAPSPMANFERYLNQDVDKWIAFVGLNSTHY